MKTKLVIISLLMALVACTKEETFSATIEGTVESVAMPCTTRPCLPGISMAIASDGKHYILPNYGYWALNNDAAVVVDASKIKEGDVMKVEGIVTKGTDLNKNTYYELDVRSVIVYEPLSEE